MTAEKSAPVGIRRVLGVLQAKAYYQNHFYHQIQKLYPDTGGDIAHKIVPELYLSELVTRIPDELVDNCCLIAARLIVDRCDKCPSPSEVRQIIAEAALLTTGLSFEQLYERAKHFIAFPPMDEMVANRWLEKVIYTTVKNVGRDSFATINNLEWKTAVSEVILSDSCLQAYKPAPSVSAVTTKRNFKVLLSGEKINE